MSSLNRKAAVAIVAVTALAVAGPVVAYTARGSSPQVAARPELSSSELAKLPFAAAQQALTSTDKGRQATRGRSEAALRLGAVNRASHACDCSLDLLIDPGGVGTRSVVVVTDDKLLVYSRDTGKVTDSLPLPKETSSDGDTVSVTSGDLDPRSGWLALGDSEGRLRAVRLDSAGHLDARTLENVTKGAKVLDVAVFGNDLYWVTDEPSLGRATLGAGSAWRVAPSRKILYYGSRPTFSLAAFARKPEASSPPSALVAASSSGALYRVSGLVAPMTDESGLQVMSSTAANYPISTLAAQVSDRGLEVAVGTIHGAALYVGPNWTQATQTRMLPQTSRVGSVAFSADGSHLLTSSVDGVTVANLTGLTMQPYSTFEGDVGLGHMGSDGVTWAFSEGRIVELRPTVNQFRTLLPPTTAAAGDAAGDVVLSDIVTSRNFVSGSYTLRPENFDVGAQLSGKAQPAGVELEHPYSAYYFVNAASAGAKYIAEGGRSPDGRGAVWLWSISTRKLVATLTLSDGDGAKATPPDLVTRVLLDEGSHTLVAADANGAVAAWNLDGKQLFRRSEGRVRAWSLDAKRHMLSVLRPTSTEADSGLTLDRIDVSSGKLDHSKTLPVSKAFVATISPDGEKIVIENETGRLTEFSAGSGRALRSVDLPDLAVALAFSPDGKTLGYSKDDDEIAFLTSDLGGAGLASLDLQGSLALDVEWSSDGKVLLASTGRFTTGYSVPQGLFAFQIAKLTNSRSLCKLMAGGIALPEGREQTMDRRVDHACG